MPSRKDLLDVSPACSYQGWPCKGFRWDTRKTSWEKQSLCMVLCAILWRTPAVFRRWRRYSQQCSWPDSFNEEFYSCSTCSTEANGASKCRGCYHEAGLANQRPNHHFHLTASRAASNGRKQKLEPFVTPPIHAAPWMRKWICQPRRQTSYARLKLVVEGRFCKISSNL